MYRFILLICIMILSSCRQERLLFYPEKLPKDFTFKFNEEFEEYFIEVDGKTRLNGLLFRSDSSKGLIFYLHGNAGSLNSWAEISTIYLENNYDFFIMDYRGYGKSEGAISSEKQLYKDIKVVYDSIKQNYDENNIIIIGYSIGTGFAAELASTNQPKLLILKSPYYNMIDLARKYVKLIPPFLIRYKLKTNEYLKKVKCPIIIFHGDKDEVIYYGSSLKLKEEFKEGDSLITLKGQTHNGINENKIYQSELKRILK